MSWLLGKAKGGMESLKNIGTCPVFPLRRLGRKSELCKEETHFLMSWYDLPRAQNFKSCRREIIPLAPWNKFL